MMRYRTRAIKTTSDEVLSAVVWGMSALMCSRMPAFRIVNIYPCGSSIADDHSSGPFVTYSTQLPLSDTNALSVYIDVLCKGHFTRLVKDHALNIQLALFSNILCFIRIENRCGSDVSYCSYDCRERLLPLGL